MEQTVSDELGLPGHTVMIGVKTKTRAEWIKQARDAMDRAEKYGATSPNQMRETEKKDLREALCALGQKVMF